MAIAYVLHLSLSIVLEFTSRWSQIQIWGCSKDNANQVWNTGYMVNNLPATSQDEQYGTNNCGTGTSQTSNCQTAWIKYDHCSFEIIDLGD
jgi:hypothetical protein